MFEQINVDKLSEQATTLAKDAMYFGVGLVVVSVQKVQEQFGELRSQLESQVATNKDQWTTITDKVAPQWKAVDDQFSKLEEKLGELVDEYGAKLPDAVEKIVDGAFEQAKSTRAQVP